MADKASPELRLLIDDDRQSMHFQIFDAGTLKAGIVFNADQLDSAILALCQTRSQMEPEVPIQYASDLPVQEIKGTHFNFDVDANTRELVFALRDPGLGWLSLRFGARLLERMLKIINATAGSTAKQ